MLEHKCLHKLFEVGIKNRLLRAVRTLKLRFLDSGLHPNAAGDQFKMGVLQYDGNDTLPLGARRRVVLLSSLRGHRAKVTPRQEGR